MKEWGPDEMRDAWVGLRAYRSPAWETSYWKNIPMVYYSPELMAALRKGMGFPLRVMFRGKRTQPTRVARQSNCLKRDAKYFSVYIRN